MVCHRLTFAFLLCSVATGGCRGRVESGGDVGVRDSSGVRIVENPEHDPPSWEVTLALSIGVADGDEAYQFFRVTDATRFPSGRIAVANSGTSEIKMYGPGGVHLRTFGGRGDGPGEFGLVSRVVRMASDALLVFDFQAMRITLFAPDGELVRTRPVNRGALMGLAASLDRPYGGVRYLDDGSFLLRLFEPRNTVVPAGVFRPTEGLARVPSDLSTAHLLGWFPRDERINLGSQERPLFASLPFTPLTMRSDGGTPVWIYVGDQASYSLSRYAGDGTLDLIVRKRAPARAVTAVDLATWEEQWRELMGPHYPPADLERLINDVPRRSTMPAFDSVAVGEAGDLWVQTYLADRDAPVRYVVFDVNGVQRGVVDLPPRFSPLEIGRDYILGAASDDEDIQTILLYDLRRGV